MTQTREPDSSAPSVSSGGESPHHMIEEYAGGTIQAHEGHIPAWLLVVYAVLFIWALYYMVVFWGGLGPGRP